MMKMELQEWTAAQTEAIGRVAVTVLEYLPSLLGAIVLLLVGWGVARLLRYLTRQIVARILDRLASSRPMDTRVRQPSSYSNAPLIAGGIIFWIVLLFFVIAASGVLQLEVLSGLLAALTAYLPRLIVGLLILFSGLWLAEFCRAFLSRVGKRSGIEKAEFVGRLGQILVLVVVFTVALGHVGINNTLLVALVAILFAVLLASLALAFAIGARTEIGNLLAARSVAETYSLGDRVRIGDHEGRILRITRSGVILETVAGSTHIPAQCFSEEVSVKLSGAESA
jgi:hypothetical protein